MIIRECGRGGGVEGCTVGPSSRFMAPQQRHPTIRRCIIRAWGVKIAFSPLSLRDAFFWRAAWRYHRHPHTPAATLSAWDHHHHHEPPPPPPHGTIYATCTGTEGSFSLVSTDQLLLLYIFVIDLSLSFFIYVYTYIPFFIRKENASAKRKPSTSALAILTRESDRSVTSSHSRVDIPT